MKQGDVRTSSVLCKRSAPRKDIPERYLLSEMFLPVEIKLRGRNRLAHDKVENVKSGYIRR
jgi:hypothetical protein